MGGVAFSTTSCSKDECKCTGVESFDEDDCDCNVKEACDDLKALGADCKVE
jgi:hypothetical protein